MIATPAHFQQFAVIDWSGAKGRRHKGIAVALCEQGCAAPVLVPAPDGVWSRTAVLDWLLTKRDAPLLVGFDFSFSAPFVERGAHLPGDAATSDARALWANVDAESDDADLGAASFIERRRGTHFYLGAADGNKADFLYWRRCEIASDGGRKPSTVYDAIGAAQVAKASFAGMRLLHRLDRAIPVWPFDPPSASGATIVEIYTSIAARAAGVPAGRSKIRDPGALDAALAAFGSAAHAPLRQYDDHSTDAIVGAAWLRRHACTEKFWHPPAMTAHIAATEGWTFGVT